MPPFETMKHVDVKIPRSVSNEVRARAKKAARANIGGLDCIGDGGGHLAANVGFATTSTLLKAAEDELRLDRASTIVIDVGSCTGRFCMYASILGWKAIGIEIDGLR